MDYIPTTDKDKDEMLKQIGVKSIKDLTSGLRPAFQDKIHLSSPMSELDLVNHMKRLSLRNKPTKYFVGAGSYNHYIPAAVSHLIQRG